MSPTLVPQPNIKGPVSFLLNIINGKLSSGQRTGKDLSPSQSQAYDLPDLQGGRPRALNRPPPKEEGMHSQNEKGCRFGKGYTC